MIDPQELAHPLGTDFDTTRTDGSSRGTYTSMSRLRARRRCRPSTSVRQAPALQQPPAARGGESTTPPAASSPTKADPVARALIVRLPTTMRAAALRKGVRLGMSAPVAGRLSATLRSRGAPRGGRHAGREARRPSDDHAADVQACDRRAPRTVGDADRPTHAADWHSAARDRRHAAALTPIERTRPRSEAAARAGRRPEPLMPWAADTGWQAVT